MALTLNENFRTFCKYLGTGNIDSKIWFVGIEEGGETVTKINLNQQLEICRKGVQFLDDASSKTPVWNIISQLLFEKYLDKHNLSDNEYRKKIFHEDYSYFFLTELFPLPRPNNYSWSDEYSALFGYSQSDYYEYLSDVRSFRYPIIYNKWNEKKPLLTICFGSSYWNEFINLFKLGQSKFTHLKDTDLLLYPEENIILTPFFDYRIIKNKEREILKELIKKI